MSEPKKQERDFTPEVDALIPEATALAKVYYRHHLWPLLIRIQGREITRGNRQASCPREADTKCEPFSFILIYRSLRHVCQASDPKSTSRLVTTIGELNYAARDYEKLNANILLLSKKHGQLKTAVQPMVEQAMGWLDEIRKRDGVEKWLEVVETLRQVTEGKVSKPFYLVCA